jgi:hypothetical protein
MPQLYDASNPTIQHWNGVLRTISYLYRTKKDGTAIMKLKNIRVEVICGASFAPFGKKQPERYRPMYRPATGRMVKYEAKKLWHYLLQKPSMLRSVVQHRTHHGLQAS